MPVRVGLAGGWPDVHHFAAREDGAVLNAAIDRYVEGSARWEAGRLRVAYRLDQLVGGDGAQVDGVSSPRPRRPRLPVSPGRGW